MRTRNSNFPNNSNVTIPRRRNRGRAPNIVEPELRTIVEVAPMAERTMEELLRAPTEGYGEAIVLPEINADHFEIKTNLLQLVQANPFHGYERENPHAHINSFKRITSTLRFRDVPNDVIKLMMFPYSLEGNARLCSGNAETEETTDKEQTNFQGSTAHIPPPVIPIPIPEPEVPKTLLNPLTFQDDVLRFWNKFADALLLMPRFAPTIKGLLMNKEKLLELTKIPLNENCLAMLLKKLPKKLGDPGKFLIPCNFPGMESVNRIDIIDAVCEEYAPELLGFSNSSGGNPTPTSEPFTSEFILEEIEAYLKDDSISPEIDYADCNPEEDICLIEKLLNNDPFQLPLMDLKQSEITKAKSLIEEPPELELKDLPSHLEYAYLEENEKLPVIIAKGLKDDEKDALLKVLRSHKWAIAWKITDIKGIDPRFCTHKILMEDDYKSTIQSQRRVNPKIHEVIKKEVLKLLDAGMIYPIFDSSWVSPMHCVPKKGGITVVANEENELILTRLVTGWRVCIDYMKLNEATRKDHFPLPFMAIC
ncbi:hypothetical protein Tco_0796640 [Tanacetum coccineum]